MRSCQLLVRLSHFFPEKHTIFLSQKWAFPQCKNTRSTDCWSQSPFWESITWWPQSPFSISMTWACFWCRDTEYTCTTMSVLTYSLLSRIFPPKARDFLQKKRTLIGRVFSHRGKVHFSKGKSRAFQEKNVSDGVWVDFDVAVQVNLVSRHRKHVQVVDFQKGDQDHQPSRTRAFAPAESSLFEGEIAWFSGK